MKNNFPPLLIFTLLLVLSFSACTFSPSIVREEDALIQEKMQSVSGSKVVGFQQFRNEIQEGAEGIYLFFRIENPTKWNAPVGYDSYEVSVYLQQNSQRLKIFKPFRFPDDKKTPECLMTTLWAHPKSDTTTLSVFVPYSDLHFLKMGEHSLTWEIVGNFVKTPPANDSTQGFKRQADITTLLKFHTPIPEIYSSEISMDVLEMDTTKFKPETMDLHLFGPGYPDIFWEIKKGQEVVYQSDSCRNELNYCRKDKVKSLFFTRKENIQLNIYDFDSFMNSNDEMGSLKLTPNALAKTDSQNLVFGYVKRMNIYMKNAPVVVNK
jgi:hypothetical protein